MNRIGVETQSNRRPWVGILIAIACILSNLSQLDFFVASGKTRLISFPCWILLVVLLPKYSCGCLRLNKNARSFYILIASIVLATLMLTLIGKDYIKSSIIECLMISTLIYSIGYFYSKEIGKREMNIILISYTVSVFIVAVYIYIGYFRNINFSSLQYEYSSKNSLSQIILTSVIVLWGLNPRKSFFRIAKYFMVAFQVVLMLLLRSRATLLSFALCIIFIVYSKNISKKIKVTISLGIVLCIVFFVFNPDLFEKLLNYSVFIGRRFGSIDELSSGRISIIKSFPALAEGHLFFGIGPTYFECFPLSCILQFGVFVGTLIIIVSNSPLFSCFRLSKYNAADSYISLYILICIAYTINSLFEGLAPIGPGVKCYFMWLLFGIYMNSSSFIFEDLS